MASSSPFTPESLVIGFFSLAHIAFASLAVGLLVLAPAAEILGRTRPFYTEAAHLFTRMTVVTFGASLVLAVIMIELFVGLFPLTNAWLFNRFRSPLHLAAGAFLVQFFLLYPYYHFWQALRARSVGLHIGMGLAALLLMVVWVAILDGIGSFMLTPTAAGSSWAALLNPTWIPLVTHRFFGNLVLAGYVVAAYAAWRLARESAQPDVGYYRCLLRTGFVVGLGALLLQPVTGMFYALRIEAAAPEAFTQLVHGRYRALVYLQFALVAALFLGSHFLLRASHAGHGRSAWGEGLYVTGVLLIVALTEHPDLRRLVTGVVIAQTVWYAHGSWRALLSESNADVNRPIIRGLAMGLGGVALVTYVTMGTIRETARRPDTVRGVISLQDERHDERRSPVPPEVAQP